MPISQPPASGDAAVTRSARQGVIEIDIAGAQLRLRGAVDETMLGTVLRTLRQSQ
jgi:transposase